MFLAPGAEARKIVVFTKNVQQCGISADIRTYGLGRCRDRAVVGRGHDLDLVVQMSSGSRRGWRLSEASQGLGRSVRLHPTNH